MAGIKSLLEFMVIMMALSCHCGGIQAALSSNYYATTCPQAEMIARNTFRNQISLLNVLSASASILRLAFHDCAVDGCEASVMLNSDGAGITDEKDAERNIGIGNTNVIDAMKDDLETACPGVVSCADVIALAGREAVSLAGGPTIPILLGRLDGKSASTARAQAQLLPATASVAQVLKAFPGLKASEVVALLGAHTIGVSHCVNIENRLYPTPDSTLQQNVLFATGLRVQCPQGISNPNTLVQNDQTNIRFDNQYFNDVQNGRGLLSIDDALGNDIGTAPIIQRYAASSSDFFNEFSSAYNKLTQFNVLPAGQGEIRRNCRSVNP